MTQHNLQPLITCAVAPERHTSSLPAVIAAHAPESDGCMHSGQVCTLWAVGGIPSSLVYGWSVFVGQVMIIRHVSTLDVPP